MKKKLIAVLLSATIAVSAIAVNFGYDTVYAKEETESTEEVVTEEAVTENQSEAEDGMSITVEEQEFVPAEEQTEENLEAVSTDGEVATEEPGTEAEVEAEADATVEAEAEAGAQSETETSTEEAEETEVVAEEAETETVEEVATEVVEEVEKIEEPEDEATYNQVFNQSTCVDGIRISLYAAENVLPDDATLEVSKVSDNMENAIADAADEKTGENTQVEKTYSFDINIYSESLGGYVQPKDGTVSVRFENVSTEDNESITVYHVEENDGSVSGLNQVASGAEGADQVEFAAEHFSVYSCVLTIDLTGKYNVLSGELHKSFNFTVSCFDDNGTPIGVDNQVANCTIDAVSIAKTEKSYVYTSASKYFDVMEAQPEIEGYKLLVPEKDGIALNGYSGLYYNGYPVARGLQYCYEQSVDGNGHSHVSNWDIYFHYVKDGVQIKQNMYDNVAFTATYAPLKATINYHSNFGEDKVAQVIQNGHDNYSGTITIELKKYEELDLPTPGEGYYFIGWSTEKNPTEFSAFYRENSQYLTTERKSTVDYYAVWSMCKINLHLNYQNRYGDSEDVVATIYAEPTPYISQVNNWKFVYPTLEELGVSAPEGYTFKGWQTESQLGSDNAFSEAGKTYYVGRGGDYNNGIVETKDFYALYSGTPSKTEESTPAVEEPKTEKPAPVVEEPKTEESTPVVEEPKTEEPIPAVEEPKTVEPTPVVEEPKVEETTPVAESTQVAQVATQETQPAQTQSSNESASTSSSTSSSSSSQTPAVASNPVAAQTTPLEAIEVAAATEPVAVAQNNAATRTANVNRAAANNQTAVAEEEETEEEPAEETEAVDTTEETETTIENNDTPKAKITEETENAEESSNNYIFFIILVALVIAAIAVALVYQSKKKTK